jgi:hypothetical protein
MPVLCCVQVMNAWLAPSLPLTMSESELQGIKVSAQKQCALLSTFL